MAAAKRVKAKEGEKLTEANIERVIGLLNQLPKPITKKEACAALNISYNTTRLANIIEQHEARKELNQKRRAALRGKLASADEIKDVINDYLDNDTVSDIAERLYRSTTFVRKILDDVGVPQRGTGENYFNYSPLPEQCIAEDFTLEQIAWSARHQAPCIIDKHMGLTKDKSANLYRVYVIEPFEEPEKRYLASWGRAGSYANLPAYELGSLAHLEKYGVSLERKINK
jgi:hypothetical protein